LGGSAFPPAPTSPGGLASAACGRGDNEMYDGKGVSLSNIVKPYALFCANTRSIETNERADGMDADCRRGINDAACRARVGMRVTGAVACAPYRLPACHHAAYSAIFKVSDGRRRQNGHGIAVGGRRPMLFAIMAEKATAMAPVKMCYHYGGIAASAFIVPPGGDSIVGIA